MLWTYQTDEMQKLFQILLQNGSPGELYQPFKITFIYIYFLTLLAYAKLASTILLPMWDKHDLFFYGATYMCSMIKCTTCKLTQGLWSLKGALQHPPWVSIGPSCSENTAMTRFQELILVLAVFGIMPLCFIRRQGGLSLVSFHSPHTFWLAKFLLEPPQKSCLAICST